MCKNYLIKKDLTEFLVDAPCSGLGVMRRKPDVKYTKTKDDIIKLSSIQQKLLEAAAPLVKPWWAFSI